MPCQVLNDVRDARRVSTAAGGAAARPGWRGIYGGGALPADRLPDGGAQGVAPAQGTANGGDQGTAAERSPADGGAQGLAAEQSLEDEEASEQLRLRPADIICAFNFSLCLMHGRSLALAYLR